MYMFIHAMCVYSARCNVHIIVKHAHGIGACVTHEAMQMNCLQNKLPSFRILKRDDRLGAVLKNILYWIFDVRVSSKKSFEIKFTIGRSLQRKQKRFISPSRR